MDKSKIHEIVRKSYAQRAVSTSSCCGPSESCCGPDSSRDMNLQIGYSEEDLSSAPEGSNLGLGCGNPLAFSELKEGQTVLDLGSGAGFDCFLAANKVGPSGYVIGVDMTPEMVEKARNNAQISDYKNIDFRLGNIEELPVDDNSIDLIISNCVINLSPEKMSVFREMFRVLKPGGRFMISDIMLLQELPESIQESVTAYVGCVSGAILKEEYLQGLKDAGFSDIEILEEFSFAIADLFQDPIAQNILNEMKASKQDAAQAAASVVSIKLGGTKTG
ncbi:arsenite methyltransferase [Acidobacteriota bacterium]